MQMENTSNQPSKVPTPFTTRRTSLYMTSINKASGRAKLTAWFGCVRKPTRSALRLAVVRKEKKIEESLLTHEVIGA